MSWPVTVLLGLWGVVTAIDLVSVPQGLLNRPVVAASVAGLIVGDLEIGLRIGVMLELFALDVLPIGASRYPDYGPAAVSAVAWGAGGTWSLVGGPAVLGALVVSGLAGRGMEVVRRFNARRIRLLETALAAGDPGALRRLQAGGLAADLWRGTVIMVAGLAIARLTYTMEPLPDDLAWPLGMVALAGGLAAALGGALRRAGAGPARWWLALGLLAGSVVAWAL